MINNQKLLLKINKIALELKADPQELLQMYFFERLLYRISISSYKRNFILKGGLLLSAIIGKDRRTSNDMDTLIKDIELENKILISVLNNITAIDCDDGITFKINSIKDIRINDIYGGINMVLIANKEDLEIPLSIDITTKDPITPKEIEFGYKCLLEEKYISIMAFTKETIIAEKFQFLIEQLDNSKRVKDFYDLYILITEHWKCINEKNLKRAIKNTFKRRDSLYLLDQIDERLQVIEKSSFMAMKWFRYQQTNSHAQNISYLDIMRVLAKIADTISKNKIKLKINEK